MPGFIDCHMHLTTDGSAIYTQTLASSATKTLAQLGLAQRDLGSMDPQWPTVDLPDAIAAGTVSGPRLIVARHLIGATGSHADVGGSRSSLVHSRMTPLTVPPPSSAAHASATAGPSAW